MNFAQAVDSAVAGQTLHGHDQRILDAFRRANPIQRLRCEIRIARAFRDSGEATLFDRIVALCKAEFPLAKLYVRAFDRGHALRLIDAGVDYQIRETFESALVFGREVLVALGHDEAVADEAIDDVRRRDEERLELQLAGGLRDAPRDFVLFLQAVVKRGRQHLLREITTEYHALVDLKLNRIPSPFRADKYADCLSVIG
jgi:hypothetical protein